MSIAAIGATILAAGKKLIVWLGTTVVGKQALKLLIKPTLMIFFLLGLAGLGMLPQSPLRFAIVPLAELMKPIPYFMYISYFVPVVPILGVLSYWILAIMGFHAVKFYLRQAKFIK